MTPSEKASWWPEGLLRKHPVNRVFVCGKQLEPPLYGYVVNFPRVELPLRGRYENLIEFDRRSTTVTLTPGTALFAPPNCWNLPTWRHPVRLISILFGKKQLGISLVTADGRTNPGLAAQKFSIPRPLTGPLPRVVDAMMELHTVGEPAAAYPALTRALLLCMHEAIRLPVLHSGTRARLLFEDVCVFLQNQYQYNVTRDSVARQFGISPNHLSRVFQMYGHMTFSNYLMHVRTDRAKHLLRSYDLKLDDVAARCGYRDTAYFCRVFRRLAKITPSEYRYRRRSLAAGAIYGASPS